MKRFCVQINGVSFVYEGRNAHKKRHHSWIKAIQEREKRKTSRQIRRPQRKKGLGRFFEPDRERLRGFSRATTTRNTQTCQGWGGRLFCCVCIVHNSHRYRTSGHTHIKVQKHPAREIPPRILSLLSTPPYLHLFPSPSLLTSSVRVRVCRCVLIVGLWGSKRIVAYILPTQTSMLYINSDTSHKHTYTFIATPGFFNSPPLLPIVLTLNARTYGRFQLWVLSRQVLLNRRR